MAVTITAAQVVTATGLTAAVAARLVPVATELVQHFAVDAPVALQDEAVIRICAYMSGSQGTTSLSSLSVSQSLDMKFRGPGSALRLSGAESILAAYRERRAEKAVSS